MALSFNGTTSKLLSARTLNQFGLTYPITMFAWAKMTGALQNGFVACIEGGSPDTYNLGSHQMGVLATTSVMRNYVSIGSGAGAFSSRATSLNDWQPVMVVFTSDTARNVYYGSTGSPIGTVVSDNTSVVMHPAEMSILAVGTRSLLGDNFFKGDIACLGLWNASLSQSDFDTLAGGAVPSTVQSSALVEYWSLLTQASTQVGTKAGKILTATSTSQASSHPVTEAGDTTAPVLTSPTGAQTGSTTATGSVTTNEANGLLYRFASANASETASVIVAAALSQAVGATGSQAVNFTGLSASTTYYAHYVQDDAAGNRSAAVHSTSFTTAAPSDSTPPTLTGTLTASAITSTAYTLTWPAGADNVAVTSYERSLDGGSTWLDVGNVLAYNISGRTPSSADSVRVRAKDGAGNVSSALSATVNLLASSDTTAPTMSGGITVARLWCHGYGISWAAGADNFAVTSYEVSCDGGTTWRDVGPRLVANFVGRTKGATDSVRVRAKDAAGNVSTALSTSVTLPTDAGSTRIRRRIGTGGDFARTEDWAAAQPLDFTTNVTSTTQAGSTTTDIVLNAAASATANAYRWNSITIGGVTLAITAYNATTKTATVGPVSWDAGPAAFASAPGAGTSYTIGPVIYQGECLNQEFTDIYPNPLCNLEGSVTSAAAYPHLTAAPGCSFIDHPTHATNPLRYDATKGAALTMNMGSAQTANTDLREGYCRVSKLQLRSQGNNTTGWGGWVIHTSAADKPTWVDRCILESGIYNFTYSGNYGQLITNSAVICTRPASAQATNALSTVAEMGINCLAYNVLFVAINGQRAATATVARFNSNEFWNCGFFGINQIWDTSLGDAESPGPLFVNCFGDYTSGTPNVTYAAFNTTSGSGFQSISYPTHDLRIKGTSALRDAGVVTPLAAVDLVGTARPQGAAWDVGPWEYSTTTASDSAGDAVGGDGGASGGMGLQPGVFTSEALYDNTGALQASKALNFAAVYSIANGALVVRKTGLSTNGAGIYSFSDAALVPGTNYAHDWETVDGNRRMPRKAAA